MSSPTPPGPDAPAGAAPSPWPLVPAPATATTAGWWQATRERRLVVQACDACGHRQHHPRAICLGCGATDALGFVAATGRGRIVSHTVVHRSPAPELGGEPYLLALVRLDEGVDLLTHVRGTGVDLADRSLDLCDRPVVVDWLPLAGDDRHLPVFLLA